MIHGLLRGQVISAFYGLFDRLCMALLIGFVWPYCSAVYGGIVRREMLGGHVSCVKASFSLIKGVISLFPILVSCLSASGASAHTYPVSGQ